MKLFWKLFCSIVIITVIGCSVSGYVLIDAQFSTSLEREAAVLYQENDLLRYALLIKMESTPIIDRPMLLGQIESLVDTANGQSVVFRISDADGETLGASGHLPMDATSLGAQLGDGQRGWELKSSADGRHYLRAATPLGVFGETLYLENYREVSDLFTDRETQYRHFYYLMPALVVASALVAFVVSALMLRPLRRLSAAARRMADGALSERVKVTTDDELGRLSADFNTMADRVEQKVNELVDANQRQEDFIGNFTHELKTPLTSIIGYAELMLSRSNEEDTRQSASYIFREGRRLSSLSKKLLDIIVLREQGISARAIPMKPFLERVAGAMRPVLEQEHIAFDVLAEDASVLIDPDLMETVCMNLLDNARKSGGKTIALSGCAKANAYCIEVRDDGKGIPTEDLQRVTEAFYMVDKSRARAQGGAGLGLALCQCIVELHGGMLEIQSAVGEGTRVQILLMGGASECGS